MNIYRKYAELVVEDVDYDIYKEWMDDGQDEDFFRPVEVQLALMLEEALCSFSGVRYAVVDDKNEIVRAAGGNSYAIYKSLFHAEKKLRWGHNRWRIVRLGFEELEDEG